jgi:hypothetical protein
VREVSYLQEEEIEFSLKSDKNNGVTCTRYINTVDCPDDEHRGARNM